MKPSPMLLTLLPFQLRNMDETSQWNPNDPSVFDVPRDAKWLMETWKQYIKPRYKTALDRWNKDTGGGDGFATSFIDYCDNNRWLVYIFCLDKEQSFLLASTAAGRMPNHLQMESGFEIEGQDDAYETPRKKLARKGQSMEEAVAEAKKQKMQSVEVMNKLLAIAEQRSSNTAPTAAVKDPAEDCLQQIRQISSDLKDSETLDTFSPESKERHVSILKKRRKKLSIKLQRLEQDEDSD